MYIPIFVYLYIHAYMKNFFMYTFFLIDTFLNICRLLIISKLNILEESYTSVILGNASVCFSNARRFLDDIRRQETEFNTAATQKGTKKDGKGGKIKKGAVIVMTPADKHACEVSMALIKFTVNSAVSTVRNIQLLKSMNIPMSALSLEDKTISNSSNMKVADYHNISMKLDFSKNSQFPIVGFLSKS